MAFLKNLITFVSIFLSTFSFADTYPLVSIPHTQSISIDSKINQQQYNLHIALPRKYSLPENKNRRYPVFYLLDANNDFPLVTSIFRRLYNQDNLDPIIIVGISYPKDAWIKRRLDYTPTNENGKYPTGGGDKFISAIEKEIIPLIDTTYRTDTNSRTIAGHSLGGLLSSYLVITKSPTFNQFIISSPSNWHDEYRVFKFAQKNYQNDQKILVSVGEEEGPHMHKSAQKFIDFINKNMPKTLLKTTVLNGENHTSSKIRAYTEGLRWLFTPKE